MASKYELKTTQFAGPIEKLLELIEDKKLDITTISLGEVTEDFLAYLRTLGEVPPVVLADFISVASRLILIKSKALLPDMALTEEEQADIKDLEARLLLYKEFKAAGGHISALWKKHRISYGRELFEHYSVSVFYPPPKITPQSLKGAIESLVRALEALQLRERNIARSAIITIEQKMRELMEHLSGKGRSQFSELAKSRDEMIALFLAVLHLVKDSIIETEQPGAFSDIIITPIKKKHE